MNWVIAVIAIIAIIIVVWVVCSQSSRPDRVYYVKRTKRPVVDNTSVYDSQLDDEEDEDIVQNHEREIDNHRFCEDEIDKRRQVFLTEIYNGSLNFKTAFNTWATDKGRIASVDTLITKPAAGPAIKLMITHVLVDPVDPLYNYQDDKEQFSDTSFIEKANNYFAVHNQSVDWFSQFNNEVIRCRSSAQA